MIREYISKIYNYSSGPGKNFKTRKILNAICDVEYEQCLNVKNPKVFANLPWLKNLFFQENLKLSWIF